MHRLVPFATALLALVVGPGRWSQRHAEDWLSDDRATVDAHAAGVARWIEAGLSPEDFGTGSSLFDGERWFATHAFAAVGHLQAALAHPEHQDIHVAAADAALAPLLTCGGWRFDTAEWGGECALDALGTGGDHAVLGYLDLPLSLHRTRVTLDRLGGDRVAADAVLAALHQATIDALSALPAPPGGAGLGAR